jgi:hypothetical protein
MAFSGQLAAHTPHPLQRTSLTVAIPRSFFRIALYGQSFTHVPQPVHKSSSITDVMASVRTRFKAMGMPALEAAA